MSEKRTRKRVPFVIKAVITAENNDRVETVAQNISMSGLFLRGEKEIPLHTTGRINITLEFGSQKLALNMKGEIVRLQKPRKKGDKYGIAVNITEIDPDSSITLFKMVQFQSGK